MLDALKSLFITAIDSDEDEDGGEEQGSFVKHPRVVANKCFQTKFRWAI